MAIVMIVKGEGKGRSAKLGAETLTCFLRCDLANCAPRTNKLTVCVL